MLTGIVGRVGGWPVAAGFGCLSATVGTGGALRLEAVEVEPGGGAAPAAALGCSRAAGGLPDDNGARVALRWLVLFGFAPCCWLEGSLCSCTRLEGKAGCFSVAAVDLVGRVVLLDDLTIDIEGG